jgi:hypothetical protein
MIISTIKAIRERKKIIATGEMSMSRPSGPDVPMNKMDSKRGKY